MTRATRWVGLAGLVLVSGQAEAAAGWEPAAFPGEAKRTVQGCALKYTDETYVCVFVRCDGPERLGLYVTAPGPDVVGPIVMSVDGQGVPVTILATPNGPLPLSNRAEAFPDALRAALKTGRRLTLVGARLAAGYDVIPLNGAGPAIGRVEAACGLKGAKP